MRNGGNSWKVLPGGGVRLFSLGGDTLNGKEGARNDDATRRGLIRGQRK